MTSRQADSKYARIGAPAVQRVGLAVKAGRLTKPDHCAECGTAGKVQGHHHNGYEPEHELDVVWLCRACHAKRHVGRRNFPERSPSGIRQVSSREFRDAVPTYTEPVEVIRRDGPGVYTKLGTWRPGRTAYERLTRYWTAIHASAGHDHEPMDCPDIAQFRDEWAAAGLPF